MSWWVKPLALIIGINGTLAAVLFLCWKFYKSAKQSGIDEQKNKEAQADATIEKRGFDAERAGAHAVRIGVLPDDRHNRDNA